MQQKMWTYLSVFVVFLLLFSLYGFWVATHPPRYITKQTPKDMGWEYEQIQLTSEDGVKLSAWFVPAQNKSDQVIIMLHGYPADKANLLPWSAFLHPDFNLLFLDFRYFGDSEGKLTTVGFKEQQDLQTAISYLKEKGFTKIGTMGFSLGGAVAILTASKKADIKVVVSDSAFANIDLMGYQFYQPLFILKYPLTFLTKTWAQIFLGISPSQIAPEQAASKLKTPILLIHSKKDQTITFENALRIQKALKDNPKAEFFFYEEGLHDNLLSDLEEKYQGKVIEFFKKYLK